MRSRSELVMRSYKAGEVCRVEVEEGRQPPRIVVQKFASVSVRVMFLVSLGREAHSRH